MDIDPTAALFVGFVVGGFLAAIVCDWRDEGVQDKADAYDRLVELADHDMQSAGIPSRDPAYQRRPLTPDQAQKLAAAASAIRSAAGK